MKHTFKFILLSLAMLLPVLAHAQDPAVFNGYHGVETGVATGKTVTPNGNGSYTIKLETFATGNSVSSEKSIPTDVVLVLDYSSSMLYNGNGTGGYVDYLYQLKRAVGSFVTTMQQNEATLDLKPNQMGHRIAFVLFAGLVYDDYSDVDPTRADLDGIPDNNNTYGPDDLIGHYRFYGEKLNEFWEVKNLSVASTTERHPRQNQTYNSASVSIAGVDILSPGSQRSYEVPGYRGVGSGYMGEVNKGTHSQFAMEKALEIVNANLTTYEEGERNTVVVFFTDGSPTTTYQNSASGFNDGVADGALEASKSIKDSDVPVFSVGLFSNPSAQVKTFVEYISSDFPNVSAMPTSYLSPSGYYGDYSKIVSGGVDLDDVFKKIAESSGGSKEQVPAQSQVVDVVSSSFNLPSGTFDPSSITAYAVKASRDGNSWDDANPISLTVVTSGTAYLTDDTMIKVVRDGASLIVDGFNYGKDDSQPNMTNPDGNWVGWRTQTSGQICAGKKLVIEFDIEPDPNATGGAETNTNAAGSCVKIPIFADDGITITGWRTINDFLPPHTTLPVYIRIQKNGLKYGESATFEIKRIRPKGWVAGKTDAELESLLEYNETTGKPVPGDGDWKTWTKVVLTQKDPESTGTTRKMVEKELIALDPYWVYSIEEDDWGWAYDYDLEVINTSDQVKNPFEFVNRDKAGAVKHAEAVMINHFDNGLTTEHHKSGKVKSF